jgi:radical SAM protein with 4Fe4S-binding SPASM domain
MVNYLKRILANYINVFRTVLLSNTGGRYLNILIDTTNGCNLKCKFCTRTNNKNVRMSVSDFDLILKKLYQRIRSLQLSCAWEYSISNHAPEIVRTLGHYSIPKTTIYSNGNILSSELAAAVIDAKINDYVVSIGESRKETYERLRRGGNFDKVIDNIKELVRLKNLHDSSLPNICANLTLVNSNIDELPDFIDLAHKIGIDEVRGRHLILNKGLDLDNEVVTNFQCANAIIDESHQKASIYGIVFSVPIYSQKEGRKFCRAPWQQLYISSNGDVSVCPRIHKYVNLGNLIKENLADLVKSEAKFEIERQFKLREFKNSICGICIENRESNTYIDQGF